MHFKSLEIVGFKSFLNKTKLKFEPGVTAVVGPNGCGKSNVVDAIKWVLGEQSAKSMRSSAMLDVIFNGTENQEPVNVAEVALTLSNTDRMLAVDYDEVTISRRLYRSGESEYLLNKTPVRLTDVRNLLMGTGIGTSSYSIVEQGRMDMILSSKPEERRYIFEEASGITRYKSKKREALLKLERTQENLVRINDIIREVERQINSIERKARKAERYKVRYEELKELDVKFAYKKYKDLSDSDIVLAEENDELKKQSEILEAELEKSSERLVGVRKEYNDIFAQLQVLQEERSRVLSDFDRNKHIIEINNERTAELKKYVDRLNWEIDDISQRKEKLGNRLEVLETKFLEISGKRQEKSNEFKLSDEEAKKLTDSIETYKHELNFNREKTIDMLSEETKSKNRLIKIDADIQNTEMRKRRLSLESANVKSEKDKAAEELKDTLLKKERIEKELERKKGHFETFSKDYINKQQKLNVLIDEKNDKEKHLNEISLRRRFLEKLLIEREGIGESVKNIMKQVESGSSRFSGVQGILSELVNLDEKYEESMKFVLGEAAQALVVDTYQTVESVTVYLKEHSMASVSFIVLDELKSAVRENTPENGRESGALNDVSRVLTAKEPYLAALKILLEDILVSADAEKFILNEKGKRIVIGPGGIVNKRGLKRTMNYSEKENIPLFGRREKIEQMKESEEKEKTEIKNLEQNILQINEWLNVSASEKDKLETELRQIQMDFVDICSKKNIITEKTGALEEEYNLLCSETEEENRIINQLCQEKEVLNTDLKEMKDKNVEMQVRINEMQNRIQESSIRREALLFKTADIKAELSVFSKEEENLKENLERDKDSYEHMGMEIEDKKKRITENNEKIQLLNEEITVLTAQNVENTNFAEKKFQEISEKEECKLNLAENINLEEACLKAKEKKMEEFRNKTRDSDIRKKELEFKRNALIEKTFDAYKLDITGLNLDLDENVDWQALSDKISEIKEQLEKMGEVSLSAVEEHRQLEERYQFLFKQKEDLVSGRESLLQAISKINRTTRKLFMETFESIKKEFSNYFRMLFAGGKAELVLEDESNVLECGIDIVVRPPGKKLHNIMQLSGGEKAMTAIALIFAIFKVNPSPFCILDEIDAPLDESNIVRFCKVLQDFIKLSQFVIVTHNRMTIQLADVLYGITMQEKGVSKVVSVKFAEEKEVRDEETIPAAV
ncbi:MAG: chromosome segregation protein SMC [Candidatus Omnitrophota bacterium]